MFIVIQKCLLILTVYRKQQNKNKLQQLNYSDPFIPNEFKNGVRINQLIYLISFVFSRYLLLPIKPKIVIISTSIYYMASNQLTAIRVNDFIDIYAVADLKLTHYWANPLTNWSYQSEIIAQNVHTKCAVIRKDNDIDLYFVSSGNLFHYWVGDQTSWEYKYEIIGEDVKNIAPTAIRYEDFIDVYFVNNKNQVVNAYVSPQTNWNYNYKLVTSSFGNVGSLCALRTTRQSIDLYLVADSKIVHIVAGNHTNWNFQTEVLYKNQQVNASYMCSIRENNDIDVFFSNTQNRICKYYVGQKNNWSYVDGNPIANGSYITKNGQFSVVRFGSHIDLYYVGVDNQIYHAYCGVNNSWAWSPPQKISNIKASGGISAVRPFQKAIDIFYLGDKNQLRNLYIGQGTGGNWERYEDGFLNKPILNLDQILQKCQKIGEGYHGIAYLYRQKNLVLKIMKLPNLSSIKNQVAILDRLNSIWENLCQYQVLKAGRLVGFSIKYFSGVKIDKAIQNQNNILYKNPQTRVRLIKKLKEITRQIQALGVCHGDLTLDNVMINQGNINKQQYQLLILDFGNGFIFNDSTLTNSGLTGWAFAKPPQSKKQKAYNPKGVNAYMLGRLALQILLKTPFSNYNKNKIRSDPQQQLHKLKKFGFDDTVIDQISNLLQNNIQSRVKTLILPSHMKENVKTIQKNNGGRKKLQDACQDLAQLKKILKEKQFQSIKSLLLQNKHQWLATTAASQTNQNMSVLWASAGVKLEDNVFFQVSAEASTALIHIVNNTNNKLKNVQVDLFKASIGVKLGAYNGVQCSVALVEGQISCFSIKLGYGYSTGLGIEEDSFSAKAFGCGFKIGRKIGISVFDNQFAIDLGACLPDKWIKTIRMIVSLFQPKLLIELFNQIKNFTRDGRQISIRITNITKYEWKHDFTYFQSGDFFGGTGERQTIKSLQNYQPKICKKVGFYGVEAIFSFTMLKSGMHIVFFFSNPLNGGNSINIELMSEQQWDSINRKNIFKKLQKSSRSSLAWHNCSRNKIVAQYYMHNKNSPIALCYVINEQIRSLVNLDKIKQQINRVKK